MAKIVGAKDNIVGGTAGALQTDFPTSVSNVFSNNPKAAMIAEGDFVPGVAGAANPLEPETGFNVFDFPSINDSQPAVVGGGDLVVMFKDDPVARAFMEYLTTPGGGGDPGEAGRLLLGEQERRRERLPRRDPGEDGRGPGECGDVPLRPLRPAAVRVRRHRRPGPVQAVPGLPEGPGPTSTGSRRRWRLAAKKAFG